MFRSNYFRGWYFKCSSERQTIAFIPAIHCSDRTTSASLQIITDDAVCTVPFTDLQYQKKPLHIKIGNCVFSQAGIRLDLHTEQADAEGLLRFGAFTPLRYDIMGPFQYIPFMQCRHSVFSMGHRVNGHVKVNGTIYNFDNDTGYVEGDCGVSFPGRYIWTQASYDFGSIMLSIADIPMAGTFFTGIIGVVMLCEQEYRIATYLGAKIRYIGKNTVVVKQGKFELMARLLRKNAYPLAAPDNGQMSRTIHESASCKAFYRFSYGGRTLYEFTSDRASFEFEY